MLILQRPRCLVSTIDRHINSGLQTNEGGMGVCSLLDPGCAESEREGQSRGDQALLSLVIKSVENIRNLELSGRH